MIQDILGALLLAVAIYSAKSISGLRRDMRTERRRVRRWFLRHATQIKQQDARLTHVEQLMPNMPRRAHGHEAASS